jgi:hypothetical protein
MKFFQASPDAMARLQALVDELPAIQTRLVERHAQLKHADRVAHQQQIAGGLVELSIADTVPEPLRDIGLFTANARHLGIGRISNGLGCPHLETDPDFLGIMLAFRINGRRIDFLGINDPTAPTDTAEEFLALLAATAESAGTEIPFGTVGQLDLGNLAAAQLKMFNALKKRLGLKRATQIFAHVAKQTATTATSSSAYQQYWTGIVRVGNTLGKFMLTPAEKANRHRAIAPGERYLSADWRDRNSRGDLEFGLSWVPYANERQTPTEQLTHAWSEYGAAAVGKLRFPRVDPDARQAKLLAVLASEMGANPGHWVANRNPPEANTDDLPATEFGTARLLVYRSSQAGRSALPESMYESVFESGDISATLAVELIRRYQANRAAGHAGPDLGNLE